MGASDRMKAPRCEGCGKPYRHIHLYPYTETRMKAPYAAAFTLWWECWDCPTHLLIGRVSTTRTLLAVRGSRGRFVLK